MFNRLIDGLHSLQDSLHQKRKRIGPEANIARVTESLETRQLLSSTNTIPAGTFEVTVDHPDFDADHVTITTGDSDGDAVSDVVNVQMHGQAHITLDAADVDQIVINTTNGNDVVSIEGFDIPGIQIAVNSYVGELVAAEEP